MNQIIFYLLSQTTHRDRDTLSYHTNHFFENIIFDILNSFH